MESSRHKGWIHRGGVRMVKANRKTLIANPLSLAFIFFHKTYVKIQDLASKFLMCLKNTVIHKISMRLNCDAFVRFLKNVKIQDLTPIMYDPNYVPIMYNREIENRKSEVRSVWERK